MKKNLLFVLLTVVFIGLSQGSQAQRFYVRVQPASRVYVRPPAPSPRHVWVEDEYQWRNGAYVTTPGYWALPPRPRARWYRGRWRREGRHGSYWVPGGWR